MLVMLICMMVGAMFFRWLQDEDYMKNFGAIIGSFTGLFIGLLLSIAIGLAVVPTTTTKIEEYNISKYYIDDKTYNEIAIEEGRHISSIYESISGARKKFLKYLTFFENTPEK